MLETKVVKTQNVFFSVISLHVAMSLKVLSVCSMEIPYRGIYCMQPGAHSRIRDHVSNGGPRRLTVALKIYCHL